MDVGQISLLGVFIFCVELAGLHAAVHAVMKGRTSQGAIAWVFALLLFPFVALPLYWVFGRNRFQGYFIARREGEGEVERLVADTLQTYHREFSGKLEGAKHRFRSCERLARLPFLSGNDVRLLIDGNETFDAILQGIDSAEEYIFAEFFIIKDDQLGREFQRRLIEKARQGVRVLLLYDEVGSHKLPKRYIQELTEAGIDVRSFRTTRGWRNRFQLNFRNHRKIVVIDGELAFVGGLNVGDEYMGRSERFGPWRDTHLAISGPAVKCIQLAFGEDWYWSTEGERTQATWMIESDSEADRSVLVLPTGPADELETCGLFFSHIIHNAHERLWIASPYFVPDKDIMAALHLASLRGVDVRILLPNRPDHLLVYLASFSFIDEAELTGVKFYRYQPGFLHQKVILVDNDFAAVGTANFDNRSFRLNFEITVAVADNGFAKEVEEMLERDFEQSRLVTAAEFQKRSFWFRLAAQSSRLMAPIL